MNLEITIRVPISGGDADGVTIATNDPTRETTVDDGDESVDDATTLPVDRDPGRRGTAGTTNGAASEQHEPPSLEELGVPIGSGADAPPGPPDLATLTAPAAAPSTEEGPPPLAELLLGDGATAPPTLDLDGSVSVATAVEILDESTPEPPPLEELEGKGTGAADD